MAGDVQRSVCRQAFNHLGYARGGIGERPPRCFAALSMAREVWNKRPVFRQGRDHWIPAPPRVALTVMIQDEWRARAGFSER